MPFLATELLPEVHAMGEKRPWSEAYRRFWSQLAEGTLPKPACERVSWELCYFYGRHVEFASAALHKCVSPEMFSALSKQYLALTKWKDALLPRIRLDERLPLPATEAIANHLLVLAETDLPGYLAAMAVLSKWVWRSGELRRLFTRDLADSDLAGTLGKYAELLRAAQESTGWDIPLSERDAQRIKQQLYLLMETAERWCEEALQRAA